ncbi:Ribokinase-like protein [Phellopilus nigrolimitatus]|nr:Ribokinase-like protein [Phellopilus nigrolimitatus]
MGERVLSIQSHVAYGYVGGKAAVFPLQCLGFDVDVVNTVNFSNHSGYGRFGGARASAADLQTTFATMDANGLLAQQRLLTGYIPSAEALAAVAALARTLRARNPALVYVLDPVMGDAGRLYVAPAVVPLYRALLPCASVITPNWFEVETLTDTPLTDLAALRRALRTLHEAHGVPHVVVSSLPLRPFLRGTLPAHILPPALSAAAAMSDADAAAQFLVCISSSRTRGAECEDESESEDGDGDVSRVHAHVLPCLPGYFSGVGDLFSALVLAHFAPPSPSPSPALAEAQTQGHTPLSHAASLALSKTLAVLRLTHALASAPSSLPLPDAEAVRALPEDATDEERDAADPERRVRRMRARELRLVQAQHLLRAVPGEKADADAGGGVELREMRPWDAFWTAGEAP